jgi:hypothetical protein
MTKKEHKKYGMFPPKIAESDHQEDNLHLITSFNQLHGYQAIRSTYHTTLQATPCQLVFGRDMIYNIAFRANWD